MLLSLATAAARTAAGEIAHAPEFLSAHPELFLARSQSWGELGFDVAAHEPRKTGEPLRIGSQSYTNGLGHHANGKLVVLLGGEFARFEAEAGLQPCASGSVLFRVSADGQALFDSGVLRSGEAAKLVSVPVAGAQELVLETTDAGDGIACDMANWANARLIRSTAARDPTAETVVNVAPFAQVFVSDPQRTNGVVANRLEEFRADDLRVETELSPSADGRYTLAPGASGVACIGLKWFGNRPLRELRLRLADSAPLPATNAVRVEGWFGESAWQGNWQTLAGEISIVGGELVVRLPLQSPRGGLLQTRKVRWLWPTKEKSLTVRELAAFTRTRWAELSVIAEAEDPLAGARGQVRVFSGELLAREDEPPPAATGWNEWVLARPRSLKLRYARPSFWKGDATVLQFQLPAGGVGVGIEDLLTNGCVYVPSHGLFVRLAEDKSVTPTLAEYKRRIAGRRTILDEVRAMPDQTFAQAMAKTHHEAQNEGPVMLSLACDNTKFVVARDGALNFPVAPVSKDDWFASAGELRPIFGDGRRDHARRALDSGWLPIPVITVEREGVRYMERVFVAPANADSERPARLNRASVCVAEFVVENLGDQLASAKLALPFQLAGKPRPAAELRRGSETRFSATLGLTPLTVVVDHSASLSLTHEGGELACAFTLPGRTTRRLAVFLGSEGANPWQLGDVPKLRAAVERYWQAVLTPATQINTPDELLNRVIRSSQVRCLIAARNEADGARVAPWIAAMHYGPLESEAHSVVRGMDFLGHHDFARRGLEFFIHRYNTNGFLTTGYTTFGTAWHLWTLGEHFQLTADKAWLRQHATDLRRVGDWILQQAELTKRTGADGQAVPESGLMPPAVMADWNSFACHFMLNGYYHAALERLGQVLTEVGDPRAVAFTRGAAVLRQHTLRAYRWTQAQAPALPLRDGSWIPHYPSQVHSPGKLADFFPGDDAGRSWAYDTELGAHQLVPTGVLAPDDPEVTRMLNHLEDVQFLGEGWFDYPASENARDWFNLGGFAKVQPYYGRNAEVYALRDDVKPFVRSYFNSLASLLNTEVLTLWEHFHHSGAWDKTHETGYFLHQTRTMLVQERGDELWLAPLIPNEWLHPGRTLEVKRAPTRFGPLSFHITSRDDAREMTVEIDTPARARPQRLVVRLRQPEGRKIQRVLVNGLAHRDFDAARQTVTVTPAPERVSVSARFD